MLLHRLQLALEKKSLCKIPITIWERKLGWSNQHHADLKALTVTWTTAFTVRLYMQKFWPKKRALLGGRTRWKQAVRLWQSMDGGVWSPLLKNLALVQFLLAFFPCFDSTDHSNALSCCSSLSKSLCCSRKVIQTHNSYESCSSVCQAAAEGCFCSVG